MSKKTGLKVLASNPTVPTTKDGDLNLFLQELSKNLRALTRSFNAYIDADIREELLTTATGLAAATGLPSLSLLLFNAYAGQDGLFHKVNKSNASWALQFGDTTDQLLIMYAAVGLDPITWATYGSMNNTGIPSATTDLIRLTDQENALSEVFATPDAESPSQAIRRGVQLERLIWMMLE